MSISLISQYYSKVDKLIRFGGSKKETSVRNEFYFLLSHYAEKKNLVLVAELPVRGTKGRDVTPDGTLKNILRLDYGLWESKDEALDLDEEIDKKIKKGYPLNNILFEDSNNAVLFQGSQEVMRVNMRNPDELDRILNAFVNFKNPLVKKYEEAIQQFQQDIPTILETLRDRIPSPRTPLPTGKGPGVRARLPESLLSNARELRKNQTDAEDYLWQLLRNRKFLGLKFRRQHPILPGYILDFYCHEHQLAIELDGSVHNDVRQKEYDEGRTEDLNDKGIKVIRFWNSEVLEDIERVLDRIAEEITPSPLTPLPNGEGNADAQGALPSPHGRRAGDEGAFLLAQSAFLELCRKEINPDITDADVREMMIQHILTSDIFNKIFDDPEFHRHNNIANELEKLIATLFNYSERKNLLGSIEHYYDAINAAAASVADHHEKQKFLKALYENFYKAYNPKAADRLGVVYTPNEIVDFMIDSTNYLLEKHFRRVLWDKNVDILDPATGTGTFICNMIDKCPNQSLAHKYKYELHANEVAILPYYVSNLNIEFIFKQKMGYYEEFQNLCFVDTLDNTDALAYSGKQHSLFGLSSENSRRITEQNARKISVIIGNPPYNANQKNENENNKNREYPNIDKRIKDSFIKYSTAQKTKVYDMYSRFFRWAMDRLDANGVIAFITNRSFIDSRTFDGFRKCIEDDFTHCYIVDTKSDVRANPKIAGTTHNVFGIQTGVAVMFLVKSDKKKEPCQIEYTSLPDEWRKQEKWEWFRNNRIEKIEFEKIVPDKNHNWINLVDNDFESLFPLVNKDVKLGLNNNAIFKLYSNGAITARDAWVYDLDDASLESKMKSFIEIYNSEQLRWHNSTERVPVKDFVTRNIKWSDELLNYLAKGSIIKFDKSKIRKGLFRPYFTCFEYVDRIVIHRFGQMHNIYPNNDSENKTIAFSFNSTDFASLSTDKFFDFALLKFANGNTQCLPLYRYNDKDERLDNITDWGLEQFRNHYSPVIATRSEAEGKQSVNDEQIASPAKGRDRNNGIIKEDIFHYAYAVLHNPAYRKKYELNLKREFPRIPFYEDFWKWAAWGKQLMDLHINYETVEPYPLTVIATRSKAEGKQSLKRQKEMFTIAEEPEPMFAKKPKVKARLKADKQAGIIEIDELTFLTDVPKEAWEYKLGNRSALEWILDQYKEKKPKDPTIAEKFNTYRFADYKEKVIDLLKRVCRVSVETVKIIKEMESMK